MKLRLQDFVSAPFDIPQGLPQGSPLLVILYLIYNAQLLHIGNKLGSNHLSIGFVDDVVHLVADKSNEMAACGITPRLRAHLIAAVLHPRILYGAVIWATTARWGLLLKTFRLLDNETQRFIGGLFRTTSNAKAIRLIPLRPLEVVAKSWSTQYIVSRLALPPSQNLAVPFLSRSLRFIPRQHKNPIHLLPPPDTICRDHKDVINLNVPKDIAAATHESLSDSFDICIYTDGSIHSGHAGAAAVIPQRGSHSTCHLGPAGHQDISGNELADKLAKLAAFDTDTEAPIADQSLTLPLSLAALRSQIKTKFKYTNAKLDNLKQARLTDWQLFKDNRNELVNKREQRQTLVPNKLGKKQDENSNLGQASIERRPGKFGSLRFLRGKDILNYRSDQKIKVQSNQINNRIERCLALQWVKIKPGHNLRVDLSWRDLRLESELAESRARAWKCKQAGLLPLPEDEDEGDGSDKTQLLKQITGYGVKGRAARAQWSFEITEVIFPKLDCLREANGIVFKVTLIEEEFHTAGGKDLCGAIHPSGSKMVKTNRIAVVGVKLKAQTRLFAVYKVEVDRVISDLERFESYWSSIKALQDWRVPYPCKIKIDLHGNQLNYLNGLPESIRFDSINWSQLEIEINYTHSRPRNQYQIVGAPWLRKLENLSACDQCGSELSLPMRQKLLSNLSKQIPNIQTSKPELQLPTRPLTALKLAET
ncbi:hypothetical protein BY996DRAFT_6458724 [Phakopsora pachyrhizi]|nr:hypothetical protein BY996DRAFT_6458724 [Phakopsora pachyrhizi]